MDNNRYIMDPRYSSSSSSRITRAMIGNMPGLETDVYSYPTTERGYHNTFVERPTLDPYYSHYDLVKFLESVHPYSIDPRTPHYDLVKLLESSHPYSIDPRTPLKANFEEDTLVLDAIPVESSCGGSSSGNNYSRRSAYRSAEDISTSIAGSKSRGPHSYSSRGKEERRLSHYNPKNSFTMPALSAEKWEALNYIFGPITPKSAPAIPKTPSSATPRMARIVPKTPSTVVLYSPRSELVTKKTPRSSNVVLSSEWSPLDDGIVVNLPSNPNNPLTRAEFESHFQKVLDGPSTRKRLPIFEEICSP